MPRAAAPCAAECCRRCPEAVGRGAGEPVVLCLVAVMLRTAVPRQVPITVKSQNAVLRQDQDVAAEPHVAERHCPGVLHTVVSLHVREGRMPQSDVLPRARAPLCYELPHCCRPRGRCRARCCRAGSLRRPVLQSPVLRRPVLQSPVCIAALSRAVMLQPSCRGGCSETVMPQSVVLLQNPGVAAEPVLMHKSPGELHTLVSLQVRENRSRRAMCCPRPGCRYAVSRRAAVGPEAAHGPGAAEQRP